LRPLLLVTIIPLLFFAQSERDQGLKEIVCKYDRSKLAEVPIILVGRVIEESSPASPYHDSDIDQRPVQLYRAKVEVENLLQGDVTAREIEVYYFRGEIPGSAQSIYFQKGAREIIFLLRDGDKFRTICDRSRNACLWKVSTGAHPNIKVTATENLNQALSDILLTRGEDADDKQMVKAIGQAGWFASAGEPALLNTLQSIAKNETPPVAEAACHNLFALKHPCGEQPKAKLEASQLPSGGWSVTVSGPPNQPVYCSRVADHTMKTLSFGTTDSQGRFVTKTASAPGTTEVWSVGDQQASPAITYAATPVFTPVANSRDRHGMGMSTVVVYGDLVSNYFATDLTYKTRLFYDPLSIGNLLQDGKTVRTERILGSGTWQTPTVSWADYNIQTSHMAVPFFKSGGFLNPDRFAEGSCFDANECQIVPLGGPAIVAQSEILLGRTAADQSAVPQNLGLPFQPLDEATKTQVLDLLLQRNEARDDDYMVAMIKTLSKQPEFGAALLTKRFSELAAHEAPLVRKAACAALAQYKQPCPRSTPPVRAPTKKKPQPAPSAQPPRSWDIAIPKHKAYSHFFQFLIALQSQPAAKGKLYLPFRPALNPADTPFIFDAAKTMTHQLSALDKRAQLVITRYRQAAQTTLLQSHSLPPAPPEIDQLDALRTALEVHQMVALQTSLGPDRTAEFEAFLTYEIVR